MLVGTYDCVDRLVLNAYFPMGHGPGGFRVWWRRLHGGSEEELDDAHLMRLAGRFSRRVRAWARTEGIPVIDCGRDVRKHRVAEEHLATHDVGTGVFLILVARAPATVWEVKRTKSGVILNLAKKRAFVNHYSFHLMDPDWGHVTIKMSGHPPFSAQVILNGHEHVACGARRAGIAFTKEGNCFTAVGDPGGLAQIADTLSTAAAAGRLGQVADRWIYSACLCFGLDLAEQERSGFRYEYSVYQVEYSRNLLFEVGGQMERVFNAVVDRARSRLDVPTLRKLFGTKQRPRSRRGDRPPPRTGVVVETPRHDLTVFKAHFGLLTLKAYTKGERVLRFEAITHNTKALGIGRVLDRFGDIVTCLGAMVERFCTALDCVNTGFIPDGTLDELSLPTTLGTTRIGGIDMNKARARSAVEAALALSAAPAGFTVGDLAARARAMAGPAENDYTVRQAAYDLRKLRAKKLVVKIGRSRRYTVPADAARTMTALLVLREHVLGPIMAGCRVPMRGRRPNTWTAVDQHYEAIRRDMVALFAEIGLTREAPVAA